MFENAYEYFLWGVFQARDSEQRIDSLLGMHPGSPDTGVFLLSFLETVCIDGPGNQISGGY
jgi:hypothetical protein